MRGEEKALLALSQPSFFLFPNGTRNLRVHREHKLFNSLEGDHILVTVDVIHRGLWWPGNTPSFTRRMNPIPQHQTSALYRKGPPAGEPATLVEHTVSTNASDRSTLTEGRTAWFFLGIDMKTGTMTLSASLHAFLLQMTSGTSLCCGTSGQ